MPLADPYWREGWFANMYSLQRIWCLEPQTWGVSKTSEATPSIHYAHILVDQKPVHLETADGMRYGRGKIMF